MSEITLLLDLDGTLLDTSSPRYKPFKDGEKTTNPETISFSNEARDFLKKCHTAGYILYVVSDSHPKYVHALYEAYLQDYCRGVLSLADKPNPKRTIQFLEEQGIFLPLDQYRTFMIGDTWLDVHLGRGLHIPTILLNYFEPEGNDIRDGIGQSGFSRRIKSGATFYASNYEDIIRILAEPSERMLVIEGAFRGHKSQGILKLSQTVQESHDPHTIIRALARQVQGESDPFESTQRYFEFSRADRSRDTLDTLAAAIANYIEEQVIPHEAISWDAFTWMPDKASTIPKDKMLALAQTISEQISIPTIQVLDWSENTTGSIRNLKTRAERKAFVRDRLTLVQKNLQGQNIIVLDDQYTTGATAEAVMDILRGCGVKNILWVTLYVLTDLVNSTKQC